MNEASSRAGTGWAGRSRRGTTIRCERRPLLELLTEPGQREGRLEHRGGHRTRAHGVDPEPLDGVALGQRPHDAEHPTLRCAVGGEHGVPEQPLDRRDQHGRRTGPRLPERRQQVPADDRGGPQVDVEGVVPDRSSMSSTAAAPETPAAWTNPPSEPRAAVASSTAAADAARLGHVDHRGMGGHAVCTARRRRLLGPGGVDVPHGHRPPDLGQGQRGRPADARPPPVTRTPVPGAPEAVDRRNGWGRRRSCVESSRPGSTVVACTRRRGRSRGAGRCVGQVRSPSLGWRPAGISDRRGFAWSRLDSTGSATPQSAAMAGSSQATPSSSSGL